MGLMIKAETASRSFWAYGCPAGLWSRETLCEWEMARPG
jgi:hypothetical protein